MKRLILAAVVLGVLFLPASAWAVNIVANPGFESGDFSSWTVTGATGFTTVDCLADGFGNPHSGNCNATFGEVGPSSFIEQPLTTVAGQPYVLSYWLSNFLSGTLAQPNRFEVVWGAGTLTQLSFILNNMGTQPYTQQSFNVIASGTVTTLSFGFLNTADFFRFDDVSVEGAAAPSAVPEPGALQLTLIGAAMIAAGRFRRRRG